MYHLTGSRRVSHQHNRQFFPLSMTPPPLSWGQQGQQHPPRRHQVFTMTWSLWNFYVDFSSTSEASGFQSHVIFMRFFADFSSQGFPQNNRNKPFGNVPFNSQVNSLIANYWRKKMLYFNQNSFIFHFQPQQMMQQKVRSKNYPFPTKAIPQGKVSCCWKFGYCQDFLLKK